MTFLIFAVLILITYLVLQVLYSGYYLSVGRRISQVKFISKTTLGDPKSPPLKLFLSGDSVGVGVGASSFETSVAGRVANYLAKRHYIQFENQSVSGARMADLLKYSLPQEKQDLIVLIISSNDLFNFTNQQQFKIDTQKVLARYLPLTKKLIVVGPGRVLDSPAVPWPVRLVYKYEGPKYAEIMKSVFYNNPQIEYLDPLEQSVDHKLYGSIDAEDNFHPNDNGHLFWFDLIKPSLQGI